MTAAQLFMNKFNLNGITTHRRHSRRQPTYANDTNELKSISLRIKGEVAMKTRNVQDLLNYLFKEARLLHPNHLTQITKDSNIKYNLEFFNEIYTIWFWFKLNHPQNILLKPLLNIISPFKREAWLYRHIGILNLCVIQRPSEFSFESKEYPMIISRYKLYKNIYFISCVIYLFD